MKIGSKSPDSHYTVYNIRYYLCETKTVFPLYSVAVVCGFSALYVVVTLFFVCGKIQTYMQIFLTSSTKVESVVELTHSLSL